MADKVVKIGRLARLKRDFMYDVNLAKPKLMKGWSYAKVEMMPPTPAELAKVPGLLSKAFSNGMSGMTMKELGLRGLILAEICIWYHFGKIIGKQGIIGYRRILPDPLPEAPHH